MSSKNGEFKLFTKFKIIKVICDGNLKFLQLNAKGEDY